MNFASAFKFIIESFRQEKIDFALIGGFALHSGGLVRATRDIDLLVLKDRADSIKKIMIARGYELLHESEDVANYVSKDPDQGRIDFLYAHRKYTKGMLKRANLEKVFQGRFEIKVLKLEDQIGLKVQSSSNDPRRLAQDMSDIEFLINHNFGKLDINILKEYFDLFERGSELENILKRIKSDK